VEVSRVMWRSRFSKHADNDPKKPAELRHSFILHLDARRRCSVPLWLIFYSMMVEVVRFQWVAVLKTA
jgi:hypothetical protein